jgi:hypothetical protein
VVIFDDCAICVHCGEDRKGERILFTNDVTQWYMKKDAAGMTTRTLLRTLFAFGGKFRVKTL